MLGVKMNFFPKEGHSKTWSTKFLFRLLPNSASSLRPWLLYISIDSGEPLENSHFYIAFTSAFNNLMWLLEAYLRIMGFHSFTHPSIELSRHYSYGWMDRRMDERIKLAASMGEV